MPSFQPFSGATGQSSSTHLHTPEATPLRKRENDSFSSPEAPLLWRNPLQPATGGLHHAFYSPSSMGARYGELNFNHMQRRRGRYDNRHGAQFWIPWVMKAILASPVVVLLIWVVVVALRHPTQSSMNSYKYSRGRPRTLQQQQSNNVMLSAAAQGLPHPHKHPAHHDDKLLPVYVPMGSTGTGTGDTNEDEPLPRLPPLLANSNPQEVDQNNYMMRQNQPLRLTQQGFQQAQPQMMRQQPQQMMGQNMMQLPQQQPGQIYQQPQQQMMRQAQPQIMYQQGQPQMMQTQQTDQVSWAQMQVGEPQMQEAQTQPQMSQQQLQEPAFGASRGHQNQKPAHPNNLRGGKKNKALKQGMGQPKVYYYDPAQAVYQGQLQAPRVVYDEHGNEIELASLSSPYTDIYLEPPSAQIMAPAYGSSQNGSPRRLATYSTSTVSTSTNDTLPAPPLPPPPLEMSLKTPESWGTSTSQDQSIIVCTVAVMALLVGALSARRLRARSFLASCIENESLEDEVAFDNAYTISGGDSYNTFGWKGDLEKFDV